MIRKLVYTVMVPLGGFIGLILLGAFYEEVLAVLRYIADSVFHPSRRELVSKTRPTSREAARFSVEIAGLMSAGKRLRKRPSPTKSDIPLLLLEASAIAFYLLRAMRGFPAFWEELRFRFTKGKEPDG